MEELRFGCRNILLCVNSVLVKRALAELKFGLPEFWLSKALNDIFKNLAELIFG